MNHSYVVSGEFADGGASWETYQTFPNGRTARIAAQRGYAIDMSNLCSDVVTNDSLRNIHVFACGTRWAVSDFIRAEIEMAEPNVHQFLRLTVRSTHDQNLISRYHLLNVCNLVTAIDPKATGMKFENNHYHAGSGTRPLAVRSDLTRDLSVWMDTQYISHFISTNLYNKITKLGARNLQFIELIEV